LFAFLLLLMFLRLSGIISSKEEEEGESEEAIIDSDVAGSCSSVD